MKRKPFAQQLVASIEGGRPSPKQAFVPGVKRAQFNPARPAGRAHAQADRVFGGRQFGGKP